MRTSSKLSVVADRPILTEGTGVHTG